MSSHSLSLPIAVHYAPDQSIGAFSNVPNGTSLTASVTNHDRSTHNGPQSDLAAGNDPLKESKERSQSESSIPASSHTSNTSQEQLGVQQLLYITVITEEAQKTRDLKDGKLKEWPQPNTTLTTSDALPNKRKKFPTPWMAEIVHGLFLGDVPASIHPETLQENNINAIISLCDYVYGWKLVMPIIGMEPKRHIFIRCEDSPILDLLFYMSDICDFIDRMCSTGSILVHCIYGRSRSPAIITAYLMRKYRLKCDHALNYVQTKRRVKPSPTLLQQLRIWEQVGYNVWEDDEKKIPKAPYRAYLDREVPIDEKRDHNATMSRLYPTGPKLEPPYCCRLVGDCPCKDPALSSVSKSKAISSL